ncbi:MAG: hypothetical protein HZA32_16655 [Opitutae bacterium]|nr:hypothetical protein [Opitutae bacterium]
MSAICGLFQRDGAPVDAGAVRRMVDVLAHWGPDATGAWHGGPTGVGHAALWVTPEAVGEACPFVDPETGSVVTADVRIDNRDELLPELAPAAGRVVGDVELLALAYRKWAEGCLDRIVGDFAFAIWDVRRRRFFCARDPMGVKRMFYFLDARRFIFGSEIKALFTRPEVPRDLNRLQMAVALAGLPSFDDQTAFRAVKVLEPASALTVDAEGERRWKYWRLDPEREITLARDEDYVDAFEEILRRSIRSRVRSTGRVGALLSGGLDATTCLALARQSTAPGQISAFSWALAEGDDWAVRDERPYIEAYLRRDPVDHAYLLSEPKWLLDFPLEMKRHRDEPESRIDHCQFIPTFIEARRRGVRVLLHGAGGDEAVSYAARDFALACVLAGDWSALHWEAKALAAENGINRLQALPRLLESWRERGEWRTPFYYQWAYRRWCERVADLSDRAIPIASHVAREVGLVDYVRDVMRPRIAGAWRRPLRAEQIYTLNQSHVISDQVGVWDYAASFGIECRCPYQDRRVVEFAVAMPVRQHRYRGVSRRLLRRVAQRWVPPEIARRRDKSPTMPDMARSLCALAPDLTRRIEAWRSSPAVLDMLDVDLLRADLAWVVKATETRPADWSPVLPLCRGLLLGSFLAQDSASREGNTPSLA